MSIIFFIIVVSVFIYQQNRINRLESMFGGRSQQPGQTPAQSSAPVKSSPAHSPSLATSSVSPASTPIPQAPAPAPLAAREHSEEASGRLIGRIGIAAVVIGMAFFLKYAFDNDWIGPAGRVMLGLFIGAGVMSLGQWLRNKYLTYSDMLMGGGMAILYLSIYSAYGFYHLVDPMLAFLGMIVVTMIGTGISIRHATMTLSVISVIGGFLTPFMIGTAELGPFVTFTYITILNAGVLGILFFKKWAELVLVALIGTWVYFGSWLVVSYNPDLLAPTLLFLLIQFLIFNASSLVRIIGFKAKATELDFFVIGATALTFAMACGHLLLPEYKHAVSGGSVVVALFYGLIALVSYHENPESKGMNIFLPGLAAAFLTIAVPIEFSGPWIAAWWFIESLVIYIVASTSSNRGFQIMGASVYVLGLFSLLNYIGTYVRPADYVVFFNTPFIMLVFAALMAYIIAFTYYRYGSVSTEIQKRGVTAFVIIANVITLYALTIEIMAYYEIAGATGSVSDTAVSIFWALYAAGLTVIGFAKRFVAVRRMGLALFIITAFKVVIDVWNLGEIYRIVSFIGFGVIALTVSFLYVKYRDRLKEVV